MTMPDEWPDAEIDARRHELLTGRPPVIGGIDPAVSQEPDLFPLDDDGGEA